MMNLDELDPPPALAKPRDLQPLSIRELEEYIVSLQDEVARAEAMIVQKQAHKNDIDSLFKK
ncbi:MAG: DUF1192 domain-containing protein [Alphaproteobacteria bacterium]|nr:DUF1192 domain-containing protein [Alphaproteobacteria bacterium]